MTAEREVVVEAERVTREAAIEASLRHTASVLDATIEALVVPPRIPTARELLSEVHGFAHLALHFIAREEHGEQPWPFYPKHQDGPAPIYDELAAELQYRDAA